MWLCSNQRYPPLPGFPGGNVWFSDHDLTDSQGVTCRRLTDYRELQLFWRAYKWWELLFP